MMIIIGPFLSVDIHAVRKTERKKERKKRKEERKEERNENGYKNCDIIYLSTKNADNNYVMSITSIRCCLARLYCEKIQYCHVDNTCM